MNSCLVVLSLACLMVASTVAIEDVLGKLLFPGKNGQALDIPDEVIGEASSIADMAKRIAAWCHRTGLCADFTSPKTISKRAATPVRDLCKFYGVKCKRSAAPLLPDEDELYDYMIDSFLEQCSATNECDFHRYLESINDQIRKLPA